MLGKTVLGAAAAVFVATCSPAGAQEPCTLLLKTSLETTPDLDGNPKVPMTIAGHPLSMLVDTGGIFSMLKKKRVRELQLTEFTSQNVVYRNGRRALHNYVKATDFQFGRMFARSTAMLVMPDDLAAPDVDGTLAPDFLSRFDVEFDFFHSRINLFEPNTCTSNLVYWAPHHAEIPLGTDYWKHIFTRVNLDGKEMSALIDTGTSMSFLRLEDARNLFGIKRDDPALKPLIDQSGKGHGYAYTFKMLGFGTVVVKTPAIRLAEEARGRDAPDMVIGMDLLRLLRLYISYKDCKIYATAAEAGSQAN